MSTCPFVYFKAVEHGVGVRFGGQVTVHVTKRKSVAVTGERTRFFTISGWILHVLTSGGCSADHCQIGILERSSQTYCEKQEINS